MFEKILYPTDFSDVSKKALGYIKQLKDAGTKEVVVLHTLDIRELAGLFGDEETYVNVEEVKKKWEQDAKKKLKAVETQLKKSGFEVKARLERGIPFKDILRVEDEENVSVVVIGSHGKSCVQEMFLGSCSEKVVRKSSKPVLVVRR